MRTKYAHLGAPDFWKAVDLHLAYTSEFTSLAANLQGQSGAAQLCPIPHS